MKQTLEYMTVLLAVIPRLIHAWCVKTVDEPHGAENESDKK